MKSSVESLEMEVGTQIDKSLREMCAVNFEQVKNLISNDNIAEAEIVLNELLRYSKDQERNLLYQGLVQYKKGCLKESISHFILSLYHNPDNKMVEETLAKARKLDQLIDLSADKTNEKKHKEAIELLCQALEVDESNSVINQTLYFQRSLAHYSLGNVSESLEDFKRYKAFQTDDVFQISDLDLESGGN